MNLPTSLIAVACSALVLGGCAAQPKRVAASAPEASSVYAVDGVYVALVNQEARRRGVQVQWVNPPSKRDRGSHMKRQPLERNDAASRADLY